MPLSTFGVGLASLGITKITLAATRAVGGEQHTCILQAVRQLGIVGIGILLGDRNGNGDNNDNHDNDDGDDGDPDLARPVARIPPGHLGLHPAAGHHVHVDVLVLRGDVAGFP